ncbi:MAG: hypothetical protein JXA43_03235 [Candidatus Diapherotrites archaeon]|nr:hypothetical protein [Candidatus Diapherotrites archaeon]
MEKKEDFDDFDDPTEEEDEDLEEFNLTAGDVDLVDLVERPAWKVILLDLVKKEKMDPWNLDITKLANAYLELVYEMKSFNFRLPANAILAASILLSLKARKMDFTEVFRDPNEFLMDYETDFDYSSGHPEWSLDTLDKLAGGAGVAYNPLLQEPERVPQRGITLEELLGAVSLIMDSKKKPKKQQIPVPHVVMPHSDEKQPNMEVRIKQVMDKIVETKDSQDLAKFSDILTDNDSVKDILFNFVPLLHLANMRRVDIWQDDFFGEMFIRVLPEGTTEDDYLKVYKERTKKSKAKDRSGEAENTITIEFFDGSRYKVPVGKTISKLKEYIVDKNTSERILNFFDSIEEFEENPELRKNPCMLVDGGEAKINKHFTSDCYIEPIDSELDL